MGYFNHLLFLFPAAGLFAWLDSLIKSNKNNTGRKKVLNYCLQVIVGIAGLYLFYKAVNSIGIWARTHDI